MWGGGHHVMPEPYGLVLVIRVATAFRGLMKTVAAAKRWGDGEMLHISPDQICRRGWDVVVLSDLIKRSGAVPANSTKGSPQAWKRKIGGGAA